MNLFTRQRDNDLMKYLSNDEVSLCLEIAQEVNLPPGTMIFNSGDRIRDIYVIRSGTVKLFEKTTDEKRIDLGIAYPNEMLGAENYILHVSAMYSAITDTHVTLSRIPHKEFRKLLKKNLALHVKIQAALNDTLAEKTIRITQMITKDNRS